jgi:hypothetical protein
MPQSQKMYEGKGSTPVPDPTLLTTAALTREIAALKELVGTRLDAMDKAMTLFNENITRVPTDVDKQVGHLKSLTWERFETVMSRFGAIDAQLKDRDSRREAENKQFALAVDKAESAITKQMDQQRQTNDAAKSVLDTKIDAVKDRVTLMEGQGKGVTTQQTSTMNMVSIVGLLVGSLIAAVGLVVAFWSANGA